MLCKQHGPRAWGAPAEAETGRGSLYAGGGKGSGVHHRDLLRCEFGRDSERFGSRAGDQSRSSSRGVVCATLRSLYAGELTSMQAWPCARVRDRAAIALGTRDS